MQHFRKQYTNGTYNPNFGLKIGVNTPWYGIGTTCGQTCQNVQLYNYKKSFLDGLLTISGSCINECVL